MTTATMERACSRCGGGMEGRGPRAKFCSKSCTDKAWYERNQAEQIERMKTYREANPEKISAASLRWKAAHPEANRAIARRAYAKTPETAKRSARARRAREAGAVTFAFTDEDWQSLLRQYRHRCAWCRAKRPLTRDHVIPLARGGSHGVGNIVPACGPCNSGRRDRLAIEWKRRLS